MLHNQDQNRTFTSKVRWMVGKRLGGELCVCVCV